MRSWSLGERCTLERTSGLEFSGGGVWCVRAFGFSG